jgi:hypothetical protein
MGEEDRGVPSTNLQILPESNDLPDIHGYSIWDGSGTLKTCIVLKPCFRSVFSVTRTGYEQLGFCFKGQHGLV